MNLKSGIITNQTIQKAYPLNSIDGVGALVRLAAHENPSLDLMNLFEQRRTTAHVYGENFKVVCFDLFAGKPELPAAAARTGGRYANKLRAKVARKVGEPEPELERAGNRSRLKSRVHGERKSAAAAGGGSEQPSAEKILQGVHDADGSQPRLPRKQAGKKAAAAEVAVPAAGGGGDFSALIVADLATLKKNSYLGCEDFRSLIEPSNPVIQNMDIRLWNYLLYQYCIQKSSELPIVADGFYLLNRLCFDELNENLDGSDGSDIFWQSFNLVARKLASSVDRSAGDECTKLIADIKISLEMASISSAEDTVVEEDNDKYFEALQKFDQSYEYLDGLYEDCIVNSGDRVLRGSTVQSLEECHGLYENLQKTFPITFSQYYELRKAFRDKGARLVVIAGYLERMNQTQDIAALDSLDSSYKGSTPTKIGTPGKRKGGRRSRRRSEAASVREGWGDQSDEATGGGGAQRAGGVRSRIDAARGFGDNLQSDQGRDSQPRLSRLDAALRHGAASGGGRSRSRSRRSSVEAAAGGQRSEPLKTQQYSVGGDDLLSQFKQEQDVDRSQDMEIKAGAKEALSKLMKEHKKVTEAKVRNFMDEYSKILNKASILKVNSRLVKPEVNLSSCLRLLKRMNEFLQ